MEALLWTSESELPNTSAFPVALEEACFFLFRLADRRRLMVYLECSVQHRVCPIRRGIHSK